ncbi:hypothetical protein NIES2119_15130 [[Phormidium ambiguum] IAM M-71]|uniref:Uncharacterized protein n=1 Tax=[Phormidium ambiguum] IAM M-71 TaxID=454136 RepID=A0A1U7IIY8_9CYAN|nr:hypothetical protein [Phormidium ambiguum]OKH37146.1 hypothetical protein NIES2119_15130 [Phormidium ambiguum IAM M-71]
MDNTAKIYTLYFVLTDTITFIVNKSKNSSENFDGDELFNRFLTRGKNQYSDILYDLVAEIGLSHYKAEEEYGRIASRIVSFLGTLRDGKNVDLVIALWIAVELALSFYYLNCENQPELVYDLDEKLRLGHEKYLAAQSNSEEWQTIDAIIKSKLGNFSGK